MMHTIIWLACVVCLSIPVVVVNRLLLSPLSRVPGPTFAAATQAYEMYHDLYLKARFPWKIQTLHQKYGPIVRIAPNEVHINDPDFAETFFSPASIKLNKYEPHQNQFGMPESTFNTIDAGIHKMRRHALAPFFSRRSIVNFELIITEKVERMCDRLEGFKASQNPVDLRLLFSCMTTDIITHYAFPNCFGLLEDPELAPAWRKTFADGLRNFQWFKHFPILWSVLRSIPDKLLIKLAPQMAVTQNWERTNQKLVRDIVDDFHDARLGDDGTIFHQLLASDLPKHEKSYERLWQEGSALIGAGVETTSNTLTVALYHLFLQPRILERLRSELDGVAPEARNNTVSWEKLETLPYLTAVIKESLRLSYGTTSRFIRVAPAATIQYRGYTLPPGTAISMTAMLLCQHPDLFKDSQTFRPERWLQNNHISDLYVFGRGSRMCAGQNLAYAELFLTLAAIVRRFTLKLHDTDYSDIEAVCDAMMPLPKSDSKGVRVLVT